MVKPKKSVGITMMHVQYSSPLFLLHVVYPKHLDQMHSSRINTHLACPFLSVYLTILCANIAPGRRKILSLESLDG
jgi:hypothetical protein